MKTLRTAATCGATIAVAGVLGLAAGVPAAVAAPAENRAEPARTAAAERSISRQQAGRIADRAVERRTGKSARVTGIYRENDFGAKWEVEVTLRTGREFDVYVNGRGKVIRIINKGFGG
jgi:hypothetical protein